MSHAVVREYAPSHPRASETDARVSRAIVATVCGHKITAGARGPLRRYCSACADVPVLLMRLRQSRTLAARLGRLALAAEIAAMIANERDGCRALEHDAPHRSLSSRSERAPASVGEADAQEPHLSSADSRGRHGP